MKNYFQMTHLLKNQKNDDNFKFKENNSRLNLEDDLSKLQKN